VEHFIIRYKVKPDQAALNTELVRAVYDELQEANPDGFHYATFQLDDGRTFIHVVAQENGRSDPLPELEAFQRFRADVRERCEEGPIASKATTVGTFGLFAVADPETPVVNG
jgi:hypothetical protein